jgi:hypothetical protein
MRIATGDIFKECNADRDIKEPAQNFMVSPKQYLF